MGEALVVTSGKGGAGKSTVAVNLAAALAIGGTLYHSPSASVHQNQYAYGKFFIEHAKQLKEGMTLAEATAIMGFAPHTSANTSVWFDEGSNSTVMVIVDNGAVKTVNAILDE